MIPLRRVIETTTCGQWGAQQCAGSIDLGTGNLLSDKKLKRRTSHSSLMLCVNLRHLCSSSVLASHLLTGCNSKSRGGGDGDLWARGDWILTPALCLSLLGRCWWQLTCWSPLGRNSILGLFRQGGPSRGGHLKQDRCPVILGQLQSVNFHWPLAELSSTNAGLI